MTQEEQLVQLLYPELLRQLLSSPVYAERQIA